MNLNSNRINRLKKIQLIVYDFDGVMTNNTAIIDQFGNESVIVNRSDGLAISIIKELGFKQFILSTETNNVVQKRAEKIGLSCLNGIQEKDITLKKYLLKENIRLENVLYVGNDINDLKAMKLVGFTVAPKDAYKPILEIVDYVSEKKGGEGVIRDLLNLIQRVNQA